jgi:hypothetical protein
MTKDFPRLPSPHPEERKLAELRAAPLIGKLILSWTELERDMNRAILNGRNIKEWKHRPQTKQVPRQPERMDKAISTQAR